MSEPPTWPVTADPGPRKPSPLKPPWPRRVPHTRWPVTKPGYPVGAPGAPPVAHGIAMVGRALLLEEPWSAHGVWTSSFGTAVSDIARIGKVAAAPAWSSTTARPAAGEADPVAEQTNAGGRPWPVPG